MYGFKITCLKCGNEANTVQYEHESSVHLDTENMKYRQFYDEFEIVCCKCGNKLEGVWYE